MGKNYFQKLLEPITIGPMTVRNRVMMSAMGTCFPAAGALPAVLPGNYAVLLHRRAFSLSNSPFETALTAAFGLLGYISTKLECEPAPLLLGFILGPMMEEYLLRAMLLSRGDPTAFFTRPISLAMRVAAASLILIIILPAVRKKREEALE